MLIVRSLGIGSKLVRCHGFMMTNKCTGTIRRECLEVDARNLVISGCKRLQECFLHYICACSWTCIERFVGYEKDRRCVGKWKAGLVELNVCPLLR